MRKSIPILLSGALLVGLAGAATLPVKKQQAAKEKQSESLLKAKESRILKTETAPKIKNSKRNSSRLNRVADSEKVSVGSSKMKSPLRAAGLPGVELRGMVLYSDFWEDEDVYGMYRIQTTPDNDFELLGETDYQYYLGYDDNAGTFWGTSFEDYYGLTQTIGVGSYDTETWEEKSWESMRSAAMLGTCCALDPVTGEVYGCFYTDNGSGHVWARADYPAGKRTVIKELDSTIWSVGVDTEGQFYGTTEDGLFIKIDKFTGDYEIISDLEIGMQDYQVGGCIDNASHTYIQAYCTDNDGGLLQIDLATGEATNVLQFNGGEQVTCLYIPQKAAEDKAPAAPELEVACSNGSMDVEITLTMPERLFDGTSAGGTLSYEIMTNGVPALSGTAAAGETVVKTLTMEESGINRFAASCSNSAGRSPLARAEVYVGKGTPAAPANVALTVADQQGTLVWDAVTESADGGFLVPADVKYNILDEEGTVIASNLTVTTYTLSAPDPAEGLKKISYGVQAVYEGKLSTVTESNQVSLGSVIPPFNYDMSDLATHQLHTVLDANGDGYTWGYNGNTGYGYSRENAADDWIFSPNIELEAGKVYQLVMRLGGQNDYYQEMIEVKMGKSATPSAMDKVILPETVIQSDFGTVKEFSVIVSPEETGRYNIGFHAISPANYYNLYLYSYSVSTPKAGNAPAKVENISILPDPSGLLKADVSFTFPSKGIDGSDLSGDVTVKVTCGDREVKTVTGAPGSQASFEDTGIAEKGTYTYYFLTLDSEGNEGETANASIYIGPSAPAAVTGFEINVADNRTVSATWDPVTTTAAGSPVAEANISYELYQAVIDEYGSISIGDKINAEKLTGTSYQYDADIPEAQGLYFVIIRAFNIDMPGQPVYTSTVVGKPYEMPVTYTCDEDLKHFFMAFGGDGDYDTAGSSVGAPAQDRDDCFLLIRNEDIGEHTYLLTGKIHVSDPEPILSFYTYKIFDWYNNPIVVSAIEEDDTETVIGTVEYTDFITDEWAKVKYSLAEFTGKNISIKFDCQRECDNRYNLIDNIRIKNDMAYDLSTGIYGPEARNIDTPFDVTVEVCNDGYEGSGPFTVELYRDGVLADTRNFDNLETDGYLPVVFEQTLALPDKNVEYSAKAVYDKDMVPANNMTESIFVERSPSVLPVPTNLKGQLSGSTNILTWSAINVNAGETEHITEDFEDARSWADAVEGWTFINVDGVYKGAFTGLVMPYHPFLGYYSWFLFDASTQGFRDYEEFEGHSGNKFLAAMFRADNKQLDDWAISPALTGEAQTVTFWAKSFSEDYPERIEIYYSTKKSTELRDYVRIDNFRAPAVPTEWTEYSFDLPEGAWHFAIRSCGTDNYMLMVDDITYTRSQKLADNNLSLEGYDVYRDNVKINDNPLKVALYTDANAPKQKCKYAVSAVYNKGVSEMSEPVTLDQSGVILTEAGKVSVSLDGREIVISGTNGQKVTVSAANGINLLNATGDARVAVEPGIYLVSVGKRSVKVIVK